MFSDAFEVLVYPGFLFSLVFGLFLVWVVRKTVARTQWRVGPPLLQPLADFLKLLQKKTILPREVNRASFISAPLLALVTILVATLLIPSPGMTRQVLGFRGDVVVLLALLMGFSVSPILAGLSSHHPFCRAGARRETLLLLSYGIPFVIAFLCPVVGARSLRIEDAVNFSISRGPLFFLPAAIVAFFFLWSRAGLSPFDISEAKTEIEVGPLTEYSGKWLGIFRLSKAMAFYVLASVLISFYLPGPFTGQVLIDATVHLLKIVVLVTVLSILSAANPRARIDQASRFGVLWMSLLSVVNLIIVLI